MRRRLWLNCLFLVLLNGCAGTLTQPPVGTDWQSHLAQLDNFTRWTAKGKAALRSSEAQESTAIIWRQDKNNTYLQLSGPFGVGSTQVDSDGETMTIVQGDQQRTLDVSTPLAIELNTGWDLPLKALPYWLKGAPDPHGSRAQEIELHADNGTLLRLRQDGWEVHYRKYAEFDSLPLPTRLELEKEDTRVTLILRQWQSGAGQ